MGQPLKGSNQFAVTLCKLRRYGFVLPPVRSCGMISKFHVSPMIIFWLTHGDGPQIHMLALFFVRLATLGCNMKARQHLIERWTMKEKGLSLNTPVFDRPVCAQVSWYLRNVNYMWFGLSWRSDSAVAGDCAQPLQHPPPNPDYRVQGRWGLTRINKGLRSRGVSDVACPAYAEKKKNTDGPKLSSISCLFLTDMINKT